MQWQPAPVLLPGESHGRRSLVGYSPWGRTESDTTERLSIAHIEYSTIYINLKACTQQYPCLRMQTICSRKENAQKWQIPGQNSGYLRGKWAPSQPLLALGEEWSWEREVGWGMCAWGLWLDLRLSGVISGGSRVPSTTVLYISARKEFSERQRDTDKWFIRIGRLCGLQVGRQGVARCWELTGLQFYNQKQGARGRTLVFSE